MIWLGALGTLILFLLQVTGVIAVSALVIWLPLLVGVGIWIFFFLILLIIAAIGG